MPRQGGAWDRRRCGTLLFLPLQHDLLVDNFCRTLLVSRLCRGISNVTRCVCIRCSMAKLFPGALTDGTLPGFHCPAALWGSQAANSGPSSTIPKRTDGTLQASNPSRRLGEARLPRHTFFLPFRNGRMAPTSSASSFHSSLPPHARELANFLCCMVSPKACYA